MKYIVSKDIKTGLYYAHLDSYPYCPVSGSFSEKKSEAKEYAKMMNYLPNKVEQIEVRKRQRFEKEFLD